MPKIKTHQATAKRFIITKRGKVMLRKAGQDHFNARESGKIKRKKRRDIILAKSQRPLVKKLLPYR